MKYYFVILTLVLVACFSCKKNSKSKTPSIAFSSLSPDSVISQNPADTVDIVIKVNDGDGDFNEEKPSGIYLKDSRGPNIYLPFPKNTNKSIDPAHGMEAECLLRLSAFAYLALRPDHLFEDTLSYEIYVTDMAGHESNHINTPKIRIKKG